MDEINKIKLEKYVEKNYLNALNIYQEENNIAGLSPTYNSLAKIYFAKKNYEKAIEYYKQSEKYSIESNNSFNLISNLILRCLILKESKSESGPNEFQCLAIKCLTNYFAY